MTKRFAGILSVFMLLIMVSSAASAYVLLNPARRWFETPKTVRVDSDGMASVNDGNNGVTRSVGAVNAWNSGGVNVVSAATAQVAYSLGDGVSDVIFSDPLRICTGNCLAATTTGYYDTGSSGTCGSLTVVELTDSDIAFNTSYAYTTVGETDGCSGEFYLESVLSHEVGHVIGLGHSNTSSALMYPSISSCNNKAIGTDDTNGRNALYNCTLVPGGGGGGCDLGAPGDACTSNADCCSNSCKGKPGQKKCK